MDNLFTLTFEENGTHRLLLGLEEIAYSEVEFSGRTATIKFFDVDESDYDHLLTVEIYLHLLRTQRTVRTLELSDDAMDAMNERFFTMACHKLHIQLVINGIVID